LLKKQTKNYLFEICSWTSSRRKYFILCVKHVLKFEIDSQGRGPAWFKINYPQKFAQEICTKKFPFSQKKKFDPYIKLPGRVT